MKLRILAFALMMIVALTVFSGCSSFTPLTGGPAVNDMVTSNGGAVVRKGDYLYFVNGMRDTSSLVEGDNKYNEVEHTAIYRSMLDENGDLTYNEEGELTNTELLIPKVVGFENGGFYIFDNYIYYASPTILKDRTGEVRFDLVDFYRANLDGSNVKKIYATDEYSETAKYEFIKINGVVSLFVFDGAKLVRVNTENNKATTMLDAVVEVLLPEIDEYNADNHSVTGVDEYIFYVRSYTEEDNMILDNGNVLAKMKLDTKTEEVLVKDGETTYSVKSLMGDNLVYTWYDGNSLNSKYYYRNVATGVFLENTETQLTGSFYNQVFKVTDAANTVVAVDSFGKLVLVTDVFTEAGLELLQGDNKYNIFMTNGDNVYYVNEDENTLHVMNVITKEVTLLSNEGEELKFDKANMKLDFDGDYLYYYVNILSEEGLKNTYLRRVKISGTEFTNEFVGVMLEKHEPAEETEDPAEGEEPTE